MTNSQSAANHKFNDNCLFVQRYDDWKPSHWTIHGAFTFNWQESDMITETWQIYIKMKLSEQCWNITLSAKSSVVFLTICDNSKIINGNPFHKLKYFTINRSKKQNYRSSFVEAKLKIVSSSCFTPASANINSTAFLDSWNISFFPRPMQIKCRSVRI